MKKLAKKLYSVDMFIKSALAAHYKGINKVKAAGFRAKMKSKDMYYISDEGKFKEELDKYLA